MRVVRVTRTTLRLTLAEIFDAEVNAWIAREQVADPTATRRMLLAALGRELDLGDDARARQLYRYMSGETPFPGEKIIRACCFIRSWKMLDFLNQQAASAQRDIGPMEGFDLLIEQAHTAKELGEFIAAHADAMDAPITPDVAHKIEREGRELIVQVERLITNAHRLAGRRPGDVQ